MSHASKNIWNARLSVALLTVSVSAAGSAAPFTLNAGFNDAWYQPETAGQGMFVNVFPELEQVFLAWFTFDRHPVLAPSMLGAPEQRWLTAIGPYRGNRAELTVSLAAGGLFDAASPLPQRQPYGTIDLTFPDCARMTVDYDLPQAGARGQMELQRVLADNVVLCETLLAELPACSAGTLSVAADDSRLRYTGRWQDGDASTRDVSWAGASVLLRFRGESVTVDLDPGFAAEQFRVVIDGEPVHEVLEVQPGRQRYLLASGLVPEQEHTLQLMKETYYSNATRLHGFEVQGCEVLQAPAPSPRRIAFFGDSNMDGTSLYNEKDAGDSGAWFAYPATVARMLDAEFSLQAFGGAQLAAGGNNHVLNFITAPRRNRPDPDYRDGFDPQVIVVNAGANDIYAVTGSDQVDTIKARYRQVVARLREVYGAQPHIILYNAYGWDLNEPANYVTEVVDEIGGRLSAVRYPWIWEQFHGAMAEHGGQARFLAEAIAALDLGFELVRSVDSIDGWGRDFNVANGGFEAAAPGNFNAFGWRYAEDGVERRRDPAGAYEGDFYIRLEAGEEVHQGTEATGDFEPGATAAGQRYEVTARVRAATGSATARLGADFEEQPLYGRGNAQNQVFEIGPEWTEIQAVFTAPAGTWKTFITLGSEAGEVDFDAVSMRDPDG